MQYHSTRVSNAAAHQQRVCGTASVKLRQNCATTAI
jgi:hypothetical protein